MKEIFEKMTGEWDWFKLKDSDEFEGGWDDIEKALYISYRCYKA